VRVVNNHHHPIILDCGDVLAAADTEGSIKDVELTEADKARHLPHGRLSILADEERPARAGRKGQDGAAKEETATKEG